MKDHLLFFTHYSTGSKGKQIVKRFYADGTYRCDHWDKEDYFGWKIDDGLLWWLAARNGAGWCMWKAPNDAGAMGRLIEAELAIFNIISS